MKFIDQYLEECSQVVRSLDRAAWMKMLRMPERCRRDFPGEACVMAGRNIVIEMRPAIDWIGRRIKLSLSRENFGALARRMDNHWRQTHRLAPLGSLSSVQALYDVTKEDPGTLGAETLFAEMVALSCAIFPILAANCVSSWRGTWCPSFVVSLQLRANRRRISR